MWAWACSKVTSFRHFQKFDDVDVCSIGAERGRQYSMCDSFSECFSSSGSRAKGEMIVTSDAVPWQVKDVVGSDSGG